MFFNIINVVGMVVVSHNVHGAICFAGVIYTDSRVEENWTVLHYQYIISCKNKCDWLLSLHG